MSEHILATGFLDNLKVLFVALMIYAIIFATLKKIQIFGSDSGVNSLVALLAAIIVSFTGVVTYAVSYAINWFFILFFIIFLFVILILFLGVNMSDVAEQVAKNGRIVALVFGVLFLIVVVKSFFALNNAFDTNNPQENPYQVDPSANTGIDDITGEETEVRVDWNFNSELIQAAIFLLIVGGFVLFLGKG